MGWGIFIVIVIGISLWILYEILTHNRDQKEKTTENKENEEKDMQRKKKYWEDSKKRTSLRVAADIESIIEHSDKSSFLYSDYALDQAKRLLANSLERYFADMYLRIRKMEIEADKKEAEAAEKTAETEKKT